MWLTKEGAELDIGKKLKVYREYKKITQEELADSAGINEKYYGRIERNKSCPTIEILEKICSALNIDITEFFLFEFDDFKKDFNLNPRISKSIIEAIKNDIDLHFNRNVIFNGCESCIWYNGYVGSMNFDEFELKLFATGNIKATLYLDYREVLEVDSEDISNELIKYISNDEALFKIIEYMPYDKDILDKNKGNTFFVIESNWLTATLMDNNTGEVINEDIILDTDNIIDGLRNKEILFDYIFNSRSNFNNSGLR